MGPAAQLVVLLCAARHSISAKSMDNTRRQKGHQIRSLAQRFAHKRLSRPSDYVNGMARNLASSLPSASPNNIIWL